MNILSNFKQVIKYIFFVFSDTLFLKKRKIKPQTMLILKVDGIGDYILFRNFLKYIRENIAYKNYEITLVGNIIWKEIAIAYDSKYFTKGIWVNRKKFRANPFYRFSILKKINSYGYDIIIYPTYSRNFFEGDLTVRSINSRKKIGSIGDLNNEKKWQQKIGDKYYDILIPAKKGIIFEFYRNKEFFISFLNQNIKINKPSIYVIKNYSTRLILPKHFVVLFLGASAKFRKWDISNFLKISNYIQQKYKYNIVLCGGEDSINDAREFEKQYKYNLYNYVGKTSLLELISIIRESEFIISNETSAPHIGVALNKKCIVISNGNHFGRFTPYPRAMTNNYQAVFHPIIERDLGNYKELSKRYGCGSNLDINEISYKKVIDVIDNIL